MHITVKNAQKKVVRGSEDLYRLMSRILQRERKPARTQEHFWTLSLSSNQTLLNLELVSLGTSNKALVCPADVFSIPLQKKAASLILVHNHPSGSLEPSDEDKQLTDRMIQVGLFMNTPILDHMILTEQGYYSFLDSGLLEKLQANPKYVLDVQEIERRLKKGEKKGKTQQAILGLMAVLKARDLKMSPAQQKRIRTCTNLSTLQQWVRNAATAQTAEQVFEKL